MKTKPFSFPQSGEGGRFTSSFLDSFPTSGSGVRDGVGGDVVGQGEEEEQGQTVHGATWERQYHRREGGN